MMKSSSQNVSALPYTQGSVPGVLRVFTGTEAVLNIILCALSVISSVIALLRGGWTALISIPITIYSSVLTWRVAQGVKRLYHGDSTGAELVKSACHGRRVLLWVVYGLSLVLSLISSLSRRGIGVAAGFFSFMIVTVLSLLILLPFVNYFKNVERVMDCIDREGYSKKPALPEGIGHLTAQCIAFAALLLLCSGLLLAGTLNEHLSSSFTDYTVLCGLLLFFAAARYLVVNLCYRGFRRSHRGISGKGDETFASPGYSPCSTLAALGSILFGWLAFLTLFDRIALYIRWPYLFSTLNLVQFLVTAAAFTLLGLGLIKRRNGLLPAMIGAALMALYSIYSVIYTIASWSRISDLFNVVYIIFGLINNACMAAFMILFLAAALLRCRQRAVSPSLRTAMTVAGVIAVACGIAQVLCNYLSYRYAKALIGGTALAVIENGLLLVGLLALVQMAAGKHASEEGEAQPEEKEPIPQADDRDGASVGERNP